MTLRELTVISRILFVVPEGSTATRAEIGEAITNDMRHAASEITAASFSIPDPETDLRVVTMLSERIFRNVSPESARCEHTQTVEVPGALKRCLRCGVVIPL